METMKNQKIPIADAQKSTINACTCWKNIILLPLAKKDSTPIKDFRFTADYFSVQSTF
jgi:hypothetical protein